MDGCEDCGLWRLENDKGKYDKHLFSFFFFFFYSQSLKEERMMLRRWNEIFHDFYIRTIIDVVKDYRVSRSSIPFLCFCFSQIK